MSTPFVLMWLFLAISVLGTGGLWIGVRAWASGDLKNRPTRRASENDERERRREVEIAQERSREQKDRSNEQRRRDDARARCELLFTVHAPEIKTRFSKQMLDAFIKNYMGDNRSAEEVEARAAQLAEMIEKHVSAVTPAPRFRSIEDVAKWYLEEKRRIENLPIEDMFKQQHLVELHMKYAEFTQQVMEQQ